MSSDSEFVQRADTAVYETEEPVLYGVADGIATLTMNPPLVAKLQHATDALRTDARGNRQARLGAVRHAGKIKHPLSDFVASPSQPSVEGDGSLGAGRPFLAAPMLGHASLAGGALDWR